MSDAQSEHGCPGLAIRDVNKVFEVGADRIEALHHIDVKIAQGELVCLIGASGCGKSSRC